jgi:hypothetical protein
LKKAAAYVLPILAFSVLSILSVQNGFPFEFKNQYTVVGDVHSKLKYSINNQTPGNLDKVLYDLNLRANQGISEAIHAFTDRINSTSLKIDFETHSGGSINYEETISRSTRSYPSFNVSSASPINNYSSFGAARAYYNGSVFSLASSLFGTEGIFNFNAAGIGSLGIGVSNHISSGTLEAKTKSDLLMDGDFSFNGNYDFFE